MCINPEWIKERNELLEEQRPLVRSYKSINSFDELNRGDVIKSSENEISYVVESNYGKRVTAVRSVDITNLSEWRVFR